MTTDKTKTTTRRTALGREIFTAINAATESQKQAFSVFLTRFRLGKPYPMEEMPGASEYEAIRLKEGLTILLQHRDATYLLITAGSEADVAEWARTHHCETNDRTGVVQIYGASVATTVAKPKNTALYADLSDDDLFAIGLPQDRLAAVRSIASMKDLEKAQSILPDAVYEALMWKAQGENWEEVKRAYIEATTDEKAVVPTSVGKLDVEHFRLVDTDEELQDMLDKPLALWRVYLHPSQKKLVDTAWHGAVRVMGGAGTGKTVVALHRARHLIESPEWRPTDKLLFTTFTKNLAVDLAEQLKSICSKEALKRVEVVNIDAWLAAFLRQHGCDKQIVYPGKRDSIYEKCWSHAMQSQPKDLSFSEDFYRDEWESVVLQNHCKVAKDYLFTSRTGRGTALSRAQRKAIWPIFEEMILQLNLANAITAEDAAELAISYLAAAYPQGYFRAVIADEIQDFKPDTLRLLRALTADVSKLDTLREGDLFLVGDPHQRIYARPVSFSNCGIEIRGRSRKLRVNYRTTDEIRKVAESVYANTTVDDMEGGTDTKTGYASLRHGKEPVFNRSESLQQECQWLIDEIKKLTTKGKRPYKSSEICIACRTNEQLEQYQKSLVALSKDETFRLLSRSRADDPSLPGVRLATVHRIKGLEYKVVFVVGMNDGVFPMVLPSIGDDPVRLRQLKRVEDALFYVACSRASDALYLSCWGKPGAYMAEQ